MSDTMLQTTLAARIRVATALESTPVGQSEQGEELACWFADDAAMLPDTEAFVTIDAALDEVLTRIGGAADEMIEPLGDHLALVDAPMEDVTRAGELGFALNPDTLSLWLEAGPEGLATGWAFHGRLPARQALLALPDNEAREALSRALERLGLDVVSELRATAGMDEGATYCRVPLPSTEVRAAVSALAEALGLEPFEDAAMSLLVPDVGSSPTMAGAEVVVGLNDEGVCAFGLSTQAVSRDTVNGLIDLLGGDANALARFEEALGAEQRDAMLWLDERGTRVLFTYRVPPIPAGGAAP